MWDRQTDRLRGQGRDSNKIFQLSICNDKVATCWDGVVTLNLILDILSLWLLRWLFFLFIYLFVYFWDDFSTSEEVRGWFGKQKPLWLHQGEWVPPRSASILNLLFFISPRHKICIFSLSHSFCVNNPYLLLPKGGFCLWRSLTPFSCDFHERVSIVSTPGIVWASLTAERGFWAFS